MYLYENEKKNPLENSETTNSDMGDWGRSKLAETYLQYVKPLGKPEDDMFLMTNFLETAKLWREVAAKTLRFWLDFFGIRIVPEKKWFVQFTPRFFAFLGVLSLASIVLLAGLAKFSTSPSFCKSCHIMKPYYQAWKTSRHNHVPCVECHYPPGSYKTLLWKKFQALSQVVKYITRTYSSKPYAEVEDASCLSSGCHSTKLLEGKIISREKGIKFDHRPHLTEKRRDRQLHCTSCHSQMVMGNHMEVTYDTCYLCHFKGLGAGKDLKQLGGCLSCHTLPARSFKIGTMAY
ncbi:MAG: NapC/NirT family cytochrome c, partial [Elusimicrobiota bacterium]